LNALGAMLPVTIRRLQVFLAVIDNKGFSAAAAALGISQPSVSVHIRTLEEQIGSPLFVRKSGSAPCLTEEGGRLCEYAREALERADDVEADLRERLRQKRSRIRCAAQRSVAYSLLPRVLTKFSETFPDTELVTHTGSVTEISKLFNDRAVDLALVLSDGEVADIKTELVGRCRLAIVAAPKHPLAFQRSISPETLENYPFVSPRRDSYFGRTIERLLREAGIRSIKVAAQMHEAGLVREMVAAGVGIACALRRGIAKDIAVGSIVELDVDMAKMYLELRLARHGKLAEVDKLVQVIRRLEFEDEEAETFYCRTT
jgi:LysR family transcriptional regulator, low CO2-responsive transcriptional regulator